MSLQGFQQAMAELVLSPRWKARIVADPAAGLAPYDLTPAERGRIEALAADPGPGLRASTMIHRSFRLSMLSNTLPLTCRALGAAGVRDVVSAYWQTYLPQNYYYVQEGLRFGRFALARWAESGFSHPLLPEVLEVELTQNELSELPPWPGEATAPVAEEVAAALGRAAVGELAALGGWTARCHPSCRAVLFRRDPAAVLPALQAGAAPPDDLLEGEHYLLLVTLPTQQVDHRAIDRPWGRLLYACDGLRSLAEVVERHGEAGESPDVATSRLRTLAESGYLLFEPLESIEPSELNTAT
jgi:hypothetical protein